MIQLFRRIFGYFSKEARTKRAEKRIVKAYPFLWDVKELKELLAFRRQFPKYTAKLVAMSTKDQINVVRDCMKLDMLKAASESAYDAFMGIYHNAAYVYKDSISSSNVMAALDFQVVLMQLEDYIFTQIAEGKSVNKEEIEERLKETNLVGVRLKMVMSIVPNLIRNAVVDSAPTPQQPTKAVDEPKRKPKKVTTPAKTSKQKNVVEGVNVRKSRGRGVRLNAAEKAAIAAEIQLGERITDVIKKYNISPSTAYKIKRELESDKG